VVAWGLRSGGRADGGAPDEDELERARPASGFAALSLDGRTATRLDERLALEEGGFGKGVGLDAAARALAAAGATAAVLDLGGQVLVLGAAGDDAAFAIADPDERQRGVVRVRVERGSLATSGNAERGIVVDGARRSHLLDPRSGRPAADWGSLTVLAPDATTADALSTGLYVLGAERALAFAAEHDGVEVLALERTAAGLRARASAGMARIAEPITPELTLDLRPAQGVREAGHAGPRAANDSERPPEEPRR
jgi:thiamine biosynthesis lipoprotein